MRTCESQTCCWFRHQVDFAAYSFELATEETTVGPDPPWRLPTVGEGALGVQEPDLMAPAWNWGLELGDVPPEVMSRTGPPGAGSNNSSSLASSLRAVGMSLIPVGRWSSSCVSPRRAASLCARFLGFGHQVNFAHYVLAGAGHCGLLRGSLAGPDGPVCRPSV